MLHRSQPLTLEDRTGSLNQTDFEDVYDRLFLHVSRPSTSSASPYAPSSSPGSILSVSPSSFPTSYMPPQPTQKTTTIYSMNFRSSRFRSMSGTPLVQLCFTQDEKLGTVRFLHPTSPQEMDMSRYLRRSGFFGSSLSRRFTASDGGEYKWEFRARAGQEWSCMIEDNVIAHYDVSATGAALIIEDEFANLTVELVTTLLIMRHIEKYNL